MWWRLTGLLVSPSTVKLRLVAKICNFRPLDQKPRFSIKKLAFLYRDRKNWFFNLKYLVFRLKLSEFHIKKLSLSIEKLGISMEILDFSKIYDMALIYLGKFPFISKKGSFLFVYTCLHLSTLVFICLCLSIGSSIFV